MNKKDMITQILKDFTTELMILTEIEDIDKYDKAELKLRKQYAKLIAGIKS